MMRHFILFLFLQSVIIAEAQLNYLNSTDGGSAYEVCYYNNYLYVGCANTLEIFDLSGPNQTPNKLQYKHRFLSHIDNLIVHNGYLYVCANHDGLWKYDITNPTSPVLISHYSPLSLDESIYDVGFYGDSILVAAKTQLHLLLDSANSFTYLKTIAGFSGTTRIRGLDVKDSLLAYTVGFSSSNSQDGIYLLNLKNLQQLDFYNDAAADPLEVYFGTNTQLLHVMGGTFVSWPYTEGSYYALDYSSPTSLQLKYSDTISGLLILGSIASAMSAKIINDTVYIATQGGGPINYIFLDPFYGQVYVYDATDANNINLLTDIYAGLYHFDIDMNENATTMYVASEWYGILTVEISDIYNELSLGKTLTGGWCSGSDYANNKLVEASEGYGIRLYDLSVKQDPILIAEDTGIGFCRSISISDSAEYVYGWFLTGDRFKVRSGDDLSIVADTTFDTSTLIISDFQRSRYHDGKIAVIEEISSASKKIAVADVSNPQKPYVAFTRQKDNIEDLLFHPSGLLFACAQDSIIVFDPNSMEIITSITPPFGFLQPYHAFTLYNDTLYVYYSGLGEGIASYYFDSVLQTLSYLDAKVYDMHATDKIFMASDSLYLYITSTIDSLKAITKSSFTEIASYNHGADFIYDNLWGVTDLYFKHDYLFFNEYMGQTSIFGQPSTSTIIPIIEINDDKLVLFPNPCIHQIQIKTGSTSESLLQIYSSTGQFIYSADILTESIFLNTSDLQAGLYFVSLYQEGKEKQGRFLVAKK